MEKHGIFYGYLEYIIPSWYSLWPFGNLVNFPPFWYSVARKIWQPCLDVTTNDNAASGSLQTLSFCSCRLLKPT
jgi:hypothetical protein